MPLTTATTYVSLLSIGLSMFAGVVPGTPTGAPSIRQGSESQPALHDQPGQQEGAPGSGVPSDPQLEQQRQQAERQARESLDPDAVAAIEETRRAAEAISRQQKDEAMAAIERAIGKINILVARNPAKAHIPVAAEVEVIEAAPRDIQEIRKIAEAAEDAVDNKDYPEARVLLQALTSEIRVRTYHLPLATYPAALREAVRLLEENKPEQARAMLSIALNTLVMIDRVTPLPLVLAQAAVEHAQSLREQDKERALQSLAVAKQELERARELGYAGKDPEYGALASSIADVERQLNGNEDTRSVFARLRDRLAAFFKRQSEGERRSEST